MRKCITLSILLVVCVLPYWPLFSQTEVNTQHNDLIIFSSAHFKDMQWRNIGPFRGGRANAVAGVKGNDLVYFLGTVGGGVWKTTDAGQTWRNISDGFFSSASIGAITVAPSDPNVVYVGTGEHAVRGVMSTHGDGMYKSTDGGQTWQHIGLAATRHIARIAVHPTNPDILMVAAQGAVWGPSEERGVYLSEDGGQTWEKTLYLNPTTGASEICIDPSNPRIIYAATWDHGRKPWSIRSGGPGSGLFKSTDGGRNWMKLTEGLPDNMGKTAITVSPANPRVLYANIEAENGGVFRSQDAGQTWEQTSNDRVTVARAWYYTEIFADPVDEQTVYVLNAPLLKSIDGGRTFQAINNPHTDQHDLWINPANPSNLILANDGGGCITFNGGQTWSSQNNQPTAQLYRVIADRRFPYHVYAGQQDYSTIAVPSRSSGPGISPADMFEVGGGESAFITFDPDHPKLIYGSSYQGSLTVFDRITRQTKNVAAYPTLGIASTPRKNEYRFNWNAPVVANAVDPSIIYHAAHKVLQTYDSGYNWFEISPDLTRNQSEKQGQGGGPFTNEGAGAEVYNTISYLASSPYDKDLLWVGTDDGLVHRTLDGGKTWLDVTPPGLQESLINCIEISPHDSSTIYVVATRHKFNDLTPYVFKTTDQGISWERINHGIADQDYVRVVREDPIRAGLLYAGTQNGLYLSTDGGRLWHRFQLNLPITPITDLTIADNDLVAATSGRGFWILDDLAPLQQTGGFPPRNEVVLIQPDRGYRFDVGQTDHPHQSLGTNPLPGIIIDYFLPERRDTGRIELRILDKDQQLLRSYTNSQAAQATYEGGPEPALQLPDHPGHNRFFWDIRRKSLPGIDNIYVVGDYRGGIVPPGAYTVQLHTPEDTLQQHLTLAPDPRLRVPPKAYEEQGQLLEMVEEDIRNIHRSVKQMQDIRSQIKTLLRFLENKKEFKDLVVAGQEAIDRITDWEQRLIQTKQETPQDAINYENQLNAQFMALKDALDSHNPSVTGGVRRRYNDLAIQWQNKKKEMQDILDEEISAFNKIFKSRELPALIIPQVNTFD